MPSESDLIKAAVQEAMILAGSDPRRYEQRRLPIPVDTARFMLKRDPAPNPAP